MNKKIINYIENKINSADLTKRESDYINGLGWGVENALTNRQIAGKTHLRRRNLNEIRHNLVVTCGIPIVDASSSSRGVYKPTSEVEIREYLITLKKQIQSNTDMFNAVSDSLKDLSGEDTELPL